MTAEDRDHAALSNLVVFTVGGVLLLAGIFVEMVSPDAQWAFTTTAFVLWANAC